MLSLRVKSRIPARSHASRHQRLEISLCNCCPPGRRPSPIKAGSRQTPIPTVRRPACERVTARSASHMFDESGSCQILAAPPPKYGCDSLAVAAVITPQ
jgi:hypothetical protein